MRARWIALLFTCAVLACKGGPPLRVGTSGDYAPFSKDGAGFDVDVARLFAAEQGRELVLVPFKWPELAPALERGDFDVAMSGVTWRPDRDVRGWLSLAVGQGGPCWIGKGEPAVVGVNQGGALELFARARFPNAKIVASDDNAALPALLASGQVDAIVTDSFEIAHFRKPGDTSLCVAESFRKVYWVAPAAAEPLGPALDDFLRSHETELQALRAQWFGAPLPRRAVDEVTDLIARRLELMPAVGAWKRAHDAPVEDTAQEARVLDAVRAQAQELGLDPDGVQSLFRLEIEVAKRIEHEARPAPALDLDRELRPALRRLSQRQLAALARAIPITDAQLDAAALAPLAPILEPGELAALTRALTRLQRAN